MLREPITCLLRAQTPVSDLGDALDHAFVDAEGNGACPFDLRPKSMDLNRDLCGRLVISTRDDPAKPRGVCLSEGCYASPRRIVDHGYGLRDRASREENAVVRSREAQTNFGSLVDFGSQRARLRGEG